MLMKADVDIQACWEAFSQGDDQAFEKLYKACYPRLTSYGHSINHAESLIHDCIQDLFIVLWENRRRTIRNIDQYLHVSFRNEYLRKLRAARRVEPAVEQSLNTLEPAPSFESVLIEEEQKSNRMGLLKEELNKLPQKRKEVIYLRYYRNLSIDEISEIMGLQQQIIRNYLSKGISTLRRIEPLRRAILTWLSFLCTISQ